MGVMCALEGNGYDHVFVPVSCTGERLPIYNPEPSLQFPFHSALETN